VSVDEPSESRRLAEELGVTYPLVEDVGLRTASAYGVAMEGGDIALPAVFVIAVDGVIRWRMIGEAIYDRPSARDLVGVVRGLAPAH
jgi:peroxiredoxin